VMRSILSALDHFKQRSGFHWGGGEIILVAIILLGMLSLGSGMFGNWIGASRGGGLLMVDLHSLGAADYGVDEMPVPVPVIGLEILQDLLGINKPPETGRPAGIALVTPTALTPTPTLAWTASQPATATIEATRPETSTPTDEPIDAGPQPETPTPTSRLPTATSPSVAPTETVQPEPTATSSTATSIPKPTATPTTAITATNTPPPAQPSPTSIPQPSPTPQPAVSPTPRPTRSSTLAVTPTADYTPIGTAILP
jgi:hypothetical protein